MYENLIVGNPELDFMVLNTLAKEPKYTEEYAKAGLSFHRFGHYPIRFM